MERAVLETRFREMWLIALMRVSTTPLDFAHTEIVRRVKLGKGRASEPNSRSNPDKNHAVAFAPRA